MEKHTDRILWTVLILAIGISLFAFGKPALVNLTNQVLHRDDLKATMQTPSLSSLDVSRISAVNNDAGVSKHAYILGSTNGVSDDTIWSDTGSRYDVSMPKEVGDVPIPYNSYAKFVFKVKVDEPLTMMFDVNNTALTGSDWNFDDNDDVSRRQLIVDGKATSIGYASNQTLLSANTWHTVEVIYFNTNPGNVQHASLSDFSLLDFANHTDHAVKFKIDDFRYAVDDQKYL